MKIKLLKDKGKPGFGEITQVYGFYYFDESFYFLVFPRKHFGLAVFSIDEVEIIDPRVDEGFVLTNKYSDRNPLFLHYQIIEKDLYEKLIELDPTAYDQFMTSIGKPPMVLVGLDILEEFYQNFDDMFLSSRNFISFVDSLVDTLNINKSFSSVFDSFRDDVQLALHLEEKDQTDLLKSLLKEFIHAYKLSTKR
jgi:hypothetical protein